MRFRRWAAATTAGMLILLGTPVTAAANDTDECADAGLISSLLGKCGLLGGLLGGSDTGDEPDDEEPDTSGPVDEDTSGGTGSSGSGDTSSGSSGGTSSSAGDTSSSTGGTSAPSGGTSGSWDSTSAGQLTTNEDSGSPAGTSREPGSATGSESAPAASTPEDARTSGEIADHSSGPTPGIDAEEPAQVVGALSELPDESRADGVARSTGLALGLVPAIIAAGAVIAIAVVSLARRRTPPSTGV